MRDTQAHDCGSAVRPKSMTTTQTAQVGNRRVKGVEVSVPIVHGSIAYFLGRKASEGLTHKWTVYVRGATNEDLGVVIERVVFELHPSFKNPVRMVTSPPFQLSECGWGEFDIGITLFFREDVCDKQLDLHHKLILYREDETVPLSPKKPAVSEYYDEIVFVEPRENFLARVQNHPAVLMPRMPAAFDLPIPAPFGMSENSRGDTEEHPLSQWFVKFSEADELWKLTEARQQVQAHIVNLRRQLNVMKDFINP